MMSAIRYRLTGVLFALVGSVSLVLVWAGLHMFWFGAIDPDRVPALTFGWSGALVMIAFLQGSVILGGQALRDYERALLEARTAAEERNRHGLTVRELEILPYLARLDLKTQDDVGAALPVKISGRTVGAHIAHISEKFDINGGRWAVVRAARDRGLLPPYEAATSVDDLP
jgi:DNA-binding CsgD family transcriptional regulator